MYREILKISPQLDRGDLAKMENSLNKRFKRVAKRFGSGLKKVFAAGGLLGLGLTLINKILNPLKEVEESMDRILGKADDVVTNAKQFNTSASNLLKLQTIAEASGMSREDFDKILAKFQIKLAQAKADPTMQTSVRNFTGFDDTAAAFFSFVQGLQKADPTNKALAMSEIFGEDDMLKIADFLQQDFGKRIKEIGIDKVSNEQLEKYLNKISSLSDLNDALMAGIGFNDIVTKGQTINEDMIRDRARREQLRVDQEAERLRSYESISRIAETSDLIFQSIEKLVLMASDLIGKMRFITDFFRGIRKHKWFRGLFGNEGDW